MSDLSDPWRGAEPLTGSRTPTLLIHTGDDNGMDVGPTVADEPVAAAPQVAALMPATGLFPEYVRYCLPATDAPPLYHLGAALALAAHRLGRRVWYQHGSARLYPNLWVALVGGGAHLRKSTVLYLDGGLLDPDGAGGAGLVSEASGLPGWLDALGAEQLDTAAEPAPERAPEDRAAVALGLVHDLGGWLADFNLSCNQAAWRILAEWYDVPRRWERHTWQAGTFVLHQPCVSLLATCTAAWLARQRQPADRHGEFWARWLFFPAARKGQTLPLPPAPCPRQEQVVRAALERLGEAQGAMSLAPAARRQYAEWLERFEGRPAEERAEGWMSRMGTAALKVAMIYEAATSGGCLIGEEAVCRAAALVEELRALLAGALTEEGTGARADADFKRVCRVIQAAGQLGIAHNALLKKLSPMRSRALRAILATLKEAGQVRERQEGKAAWYRWM
jgi:hypothetical protein